jgi:uncharacterized Zn finger protein
MARNGDGRSAGWWSSRWFRWLHEVGVSSDSNAPHDQTRGARVQRLEVQMGSIEARVRDRELGDCLCHIGLETLDDAQWTTALDALSEQALYAAQLLAGDMPPEIETVFQDAGIGLLPASMDELAQQCDCCPDAGAGPAAVCRPLLATYVALGEMLSDDPWLLFRLRGRDRQQILAGLRERRSRSATGGRTTVPTVAQTSVAEEPAIYRAETPAETVPAAEADLAAALEHFWGSAKPLQEFHHYVGAPAIELVALRRLGPPPFSQDSDRVYDGLAAIYRQITEAALTVAYAEENDDETLDLEEDVPREEDGL